MSFVCMVISLAHAHLTSQVPIKGQGTGLHELSSTQVNVSLKTGSVSPELKQTTELRKR
jgi:hypothetical protein